LSENINGVSTEFTAFEKEQLPAFSGVKLTAEKYHNKQLITLHVLSLSQ
jgi:hypothetical protein